VRHPSAETKRALETSEFRSERGRIRKSSDLWTADLLL
jgi:hypothetical protein